MDMGRNGKRKDKESRKEAKAAMLHPETTRAIVAIALFLGAIVLMLAFGGLGGKGGEFALDAFRTILGKGFFLVPLSLILASLSIFTSLHERFYAPTFIGSGLFLLAL